MPTKANKAGKQQPYVPAGHGDPSGEYAENNTGSNKNYASPDDVKRQLGYTPKKEKTETKTPKDVVKSGKNEPTPAEREKLVNMGIITEDMKSATYTEKFAPNVKITRGSFSKDEIGEFNAYLEKVFNDYPEMQKFRNIFVKNNTSSDTGGYIKTSTNLFSGEKNYELYINAGWLEDRQAISDEKTLNWYKSQVKYIENQLINLTDNNRKSNLENLLNNFKEAINNIEKRRKTPRTEFSNVINRCTTRSERLKSIMAHEMMHRITQDFDDAIINKKITGELKQKHSDLTKKILEVYDEAIKNGDAKKISNYATKNRDEFLSEANSMIEGGYKMPAYIKEVVEELKDFNRRIKI